MNSASILRSQLSVTWKRLHDALDHDGPAEGCQEWQCIESREIIKRSQEEVLEVNCGDVSVSRRLRENKANRVIVVEV